MKNPLKMPVVLTAVLAFMAIGVSSFYMNNSSKDPKTPVTITDQNFDQITGKGVVMVDFWAVWCRPCRMMGPIIDTLAIEMDGKAVIGKLDVDKNKGTSQRFGVSSIPTFIIFKDGQAVKRFIGMQSKETLVAALEEVSSMKKNRASTK